MKSHVSDYRPILLHMGWLPLARICRCVSRSLSDSDWDLYPLFVDSAIIILCCMELKSKHKHKHGYWWLDFKQELWFLHSLLLRSRDKRSPASYKSEEIRLPHGGSSWIIVLLCFASFLLCNMDRGVAMNKMLSKWIPVSERSTSLALVYSGMYLGSVTGLGFSPMLIHQFSIPLAPLEVYGFCYGLNMHIALPKMTLS